MPICSFNKNVLFIHKEDKQMNQIYNFTSQVHNYENLRQQQRQKKKKGTVKSSLTLLMEEVTHDLFRVNSLDK